MRTQRGIVAGVIVLGVLGLAAAGPEPDEARRLDPEVAAVRLLLGVGDRQTDGWGGRVKLDKGEVVGVEGWRFRDGDAVTGRDSWEARSRLIRTKKAQAKKKAAVKTPPAPADKPDPRGRGQATGPGNTGPAVTPNGVVVSLKAPDDATLTVSTERGEFAVTLAELADGSARRFLDGRAEAQRVATHAPLVVGPHQQDFPAAVPDGKGGAWVVYVEHRPRGPEVSEALRERPKSFAHFVPTGGGDQVRVVHFNDGRAGEPIEVTEPGLDVWRPSAVVDRRGRVVVVWSENQDGNWDLYHRRYDPEARTWSDRARLTKNSGPDVDAVLATDQRDRVWMAWQTWRDGQADIWLDSIQDPTTERVKIPITSTPTNEWAPAIVADQDVVYVAYDTYKDGNYDVMLTGVSAKVEGPGVLRTTPVAASARFEVRPSLARDGRGRVWVAYEERDAQWGKDAENLVEGQGSSLYRSSAVRVRCVDGERVFDAPDPLAQAPEGVRVMNSYPRLTLDPSGRPWLAFRHRQEAIWGNNSVMVVGAVWVEYATALVGRTWSVPQLLPRSDGLLDNRPALVPVGDGPVLAFYNTDGRLHREVEFTDDLRRRFYTHSGTPPGVVDNDLMVAALVPPGGAGAVEPALTEVSPLPMNPRRDNAGPAPASGRSAPEPSVHPNEAADVARMRGHRIEAGGKTYRLLRGEFHRHTEISQDGGNDGSLEDMWRYAIDAARLDWIGNGDHDSGGGKEYTWWLVQKATDLYHVPPAFVPMHTYERSVGYPGGHRNVMWPRRGIRTLPRLVDEKGVRIDHRGPNEDTLMLYDYLRELNGICAAHTSGTGMGTDWRDNDPKVEPFVEIFQGHRNSYEHLGGPRVARRQSEAIGGWRPLGMVWNALAMGHRLGFQASSDHVSTHISFAVAIAEQPTREAIFDAFRRRHCYGATDNIVLDVRSGEHLMGDEFEADGPVRLKVLAHGTRPIARVDVIKDFVYVYSTEPRAERAEFTWTDAETRPPGLSWYYVRVIQDDGEIAWGSPIWVHTRGGL